MKYKEQRITLTAANAEAATELAAFDAALHTMGVGNANLLHLSSVIPRNFTIAKLDKQPEFGTEGDRLYCVYAEKRESQPGQTAAAGLGWVMTAGDNPWGLFVEHTGHSEAEVEKQIALSLNAMMSYREQEVWGSIESYTTSITCAHEPVCAIVLASYQSQNW